MADETLEAYGVAFQTAWHAGLRAKIGLPGDEEEDGDLALDLLGRMSGQGADFTNTFRCLCEVDFADPGRDQAVRDQFQNPAVFDEWAANWRIRMARIPAAEADRREGMRFNA